ncbi:hypothetical protein JCM15754A_05960 [Prevotella aurantiaca JCM 15754]|uniref:CfrBI family restriction endonuclease n=1 Tax=Prevotella aurantiaca TaxID=596085 RepID=UPI00046875A1|nr:CfrBI family restriction endonuclease [Prevotella aurantiaca]
MTLTDQVIKNIVSRVIKSQDYRIEVVNLINAEFLQFAIDFFKKVVEAKLTSTDITIEWYKNAFMNDTLPSEDIAINSGLNTKTISNMYRSAKRKIVIEASNDHFDSLYNSIQALVENENEIELTLTIKLKGVSVDLNVSESLIVINTLAVKRAALRGGMWSTAGKRAEKYLMLTLCKLYKVDSQYYNAEHFIRNRELDVDREIDFYLINQDNKYKCEVKLMGQGNPESADAIIARGSHVFVADTLSQQNKNQCDQLNVSWVACRDENGYKRFAQVLQRFDIPFTEYNGNLEEDLPEILDSII